MILCQFEDFPALIAAGSVQQVQTLTWDFSNLIPPNTTLQGTPTVVLVPLSGAPAVVINSPPQIGIANLTQVLQGRPQCAVLAQVGPLTAGAKYICQVSCPVTPNAIGVSDVAAGFNHIQGEAPF